MNREIKVKIYDKNDTQFLIGPFDWNKIPQFLFPDNYIISQYTGLKDRLGKEIYEGDILKYEYSQAECSSFAMQESPLKFEDLCVVEYNRGAFRFKGDKFGCIADECEQMTIVGNAFENFDLLYTEEERKTMEYKFVNSRENEY